MSQERRLFVEALPPGGGSVTLDDDASRHARVLRLEPGDPLVLFDGTGQEAAGRITSQGEQGVVCQADAPRPATIVGPRVVLVQCTPKGQKLDTIVRMCTEIGVSEIQLAVSSRTISRPDDKRTLGKLERFARIAREATRQSRRAVIPHIMAPAPLAEVAQRAPGSAARCVLSTRAARPMAAALFAGSDEAWLVVGPEGGLDEQEEAQLNALGYVSVTLGSGTLRTETAGPAGVLIALDRMGGLGP